MPVTEKREGGFVTYRTSSGYPYGTRALAEEAEKIEQAGAAQATRPHSTVPSVQSGAPVAGVEDVYAFYHAQLEKAVASEPSPAQIVARRQAIERAGAQ